MRLPLVLLRSKVSGDEPMSRGPVGTAGNSGYNWRTLGGADRPSPAFSTSP